MKIVMYKFGERGYRLGVLEGSDRIVDLNLSYEVFLEKEGELRAKELSEAVLPPDSVAFLRGGQRSMAAAEDALKAVKNFKENDLSPNGKRIVFRRDEVSLGAPIQNPMRVICLAHNYKDLLEETGSPKPPEPRIFSKFNNALCGPEDPIIYPKMTKELGYEAELAVVIGKRARNVSEENIMEYIAGYMNFNDVSASDLTKKDKQVLRGKTFDSFAPCGPYLITRDEVPEPGNLDIKLWVNDKLRQNSNTSQLYFDIPTSLSFISHIFTLEPGDIIATGSPSGLAKDQNPPTFMNVGDTCTIEIEKLGTLQNKIVGAEN